MTYNSLFPIAYNFLKKITPLDLIFNAWPLLSSKVCWFGEKPIDQFSKKFRKPTFYYHITSRFFCIGFSPNKTCKSKICSLPNSHPGMESRSIDFGCVQWTVSAVLRVMSMQVTTNKYWLICESPECGQILLLTTQLYLPGDIYVAFAYFHNPGLGGLSGLDFVLNDLVMVLWWMFNFPKDLGK